jgi:hypothetical protein
MDNTVSPEEFAELNRLLASSPEGRRYYGEVIDEYRTLYECTEILSSLQPAAEPVLQAGLWQSLAENERNADTIIPSPIVTAPDHSTEKEPAIRVDHRINKFSLYTAIVSLAALILILTYVQLVPRIDHQFCGYVARTIDAEWQPDASPVTEGAAVYSGSFTLDKGLAELVLESGAKIILQGPIQLKIESPNRIFLDQGNIAVSFQKGDTNKQFIVRTPNSCVVDFGTEFGVSVTPSGLTETHVRQGIVELRGGTNPSRFKQSLRLQASQAGRSESDGSLKEIRYEKTKFVYKNEFNIRIKATEGSGYYRWLAYSYQLRRDQDLVLYYPFAKTEGSQSGVANTAAGTENTLNGTFGGTFGISNFVAPSWAEGRWPDKSALRFERATRTCITVPAAPALNLSGDITLTAWVRCLDAQKGGHIFSCRQGERVNYQFGCFAAEEPYYPRKMQMLRTNVPFASTMYSSRLFDWTTEWTLLTVTHDTKTIHFYVNGELFESIPFEYEAQSVSAPLIIGDVPSFEGRTFGYAAFNGLMDEIAVFKRVLSVSEIRAMYEAGKP